MDRRAAGPLARVHARILKVACTLADLEGSENLTVAHLAEAIQDRDAESRLPGPEQAFSTG